MIVVCDAQRRQKGPIDIHKPIFFSIMTSYGFVGLSFVLQFSLSTRQMNLVFFANIYLHLVSDR